MNAISRGYSKTKIGQVHWRIWHPEGAAELPDLFCLHPSPFSGLAYQNIAPHLAKGRRIIAADYPGYGGSDGTSQPSIELYAELMFEVADYLKTGDTIDVLGFHSGCFVAAEMARMRPEKVGTLCMIDIPAIDPSDVAKMIADHEGAFVITDQLTCLEREWKTTFKSRVETQGREQAFAMFVEQLRSGEKRNDAAIAAFAYPWPERFPEITTETLVIATQSMLLDMTRGSAAHLPAARLVERLDITRSVLDEAAEETAREVRAFLEGAN